MQGLGSGAPSPPEPQSPSQVLRVDPSFQHFPTQPGERIRKKKIVPYLFSSLAPSSQITPLLQLELMGLNLFLPPVSTPSNNTPPHS